MDCYPEYDGYQDVVFTAHWTVTETASGYTGSVYGSQTLELDSSESFTPYDDLTQEQVIGWVQSSIGAEQVAEIEANVNQQIQNQINPPVVNPPLPW